MARIKHIPRTKLANSRKSSAPSQSSPQEVAAPNTTWTAVIELGASNGQAMVKKSGGHWELVRWAQGVGASSVGGAEAIPAMSVLKREGRSAEMRHGHAAVRARKMKPSNWEVFSHPKLVFMKDDEIPVDIQRILQLQDEVARTYETTSKEVAVEFFQHMMREVVGTTTEGFKIYVNVSDSWRNSKVQELMLSFQSVREDVQFEAVDECLSSLVGRLSNDPKGLTAEGLYVVVDCGHSTLNVGVAEIAPGPTYKVHQYDTENTGAGAINLAVEDEVRKINRTNGAKSGDANVWEVSEFIDDFFKPEPDTESSPRFGFSQEEWDRIMDRARKANATLDDDRIKIIRQSLTDALVRLASRELSDALETHREDLRILLTGRGARSPTFRAALKVMVSQDFADASIHEDGETHKTAVLVGLARIADNPDIMSVKEAPVSLWMRSDPDDADGEEDQTTVVRICTQGQSLDASGDVRDRLSSSHPVHIELIPPPGGPAVLDLSIFGTPEGVSDDDIVVGWNADRFAYTSTERVTEFGRYQRQLPGSFSSDGGLVFHVYLYAELSKLSVQLYAVFAKDGHEIATLSRTPVKDAIQSSGISKKWETHQGVSLDVVRLRQVARSEALSAKRQESSTPSNQLLGTLHRSASPASRIQVQGNRGSAVKTISKRKATLPKRNLVQQRKVMEAKRRKLSSNRRASDRYEISNDGTESDVEA